jgi:hypothetical protein
MKKITILLLLCTIVVLHHEMVVTMHRSLIRLGESSVMAAAAALLYHYNSGLKTKGQELNPLDHEVIMHFYQESAQAQNPLFQTLKREAVEEKDNWFDPYFSAKICHNGCVSDQITLASQSLSTQCRFQYDYDQKTGQEVLSRYACETCLNHQQFKRHIAQGISEGRIK